MQAVQPTLVNHTAYRCGLYSLHTWAIKTSPLKLALSLIHILKNYEGAITAAQEAITLSGGTIVSTKEDYKNTVSYTHLDVYKRQYILCPNITFTP